MRTRRDAAREFVPAVEWDSDHRQGLFERREEEAVLLTGDEALVELAATIQYRVSDLERFLFRVREPQDLLRSLAEGCVRQVVAARPLLSDSNYRDNDSAPNGHDILTTARREIEIEIRDLLQDRADAYGLGVEILPGGVCLQDVHPPLDVVEAFRNVSRAFKKMGRMKNEADRDYRARLIESAGVAVWQQLEGQPIEITDEVWNDFARQLEGTAAQSLHRAEAATTLETAEAEGRAEIFVRQQGAYAAEPKLAALRMYLEEIAAAMAGKKKLILDNHSTGRRQLFFGAPDSLAPFLSAPRDAEPPVFDTPDLSSLTRIACPMHDEPHAHDHSHSSGEAAHDHHHSHGEAAHDHHHSHGGDHQHSHAHDHHHERDRRATPPLITRNRILGLLVIVALVVLAWRTFFFVDETEYVFVTQFGEPVRLHVEPGLGIKMPYQSPRRLDRRLRMYDPPGREILTEDKENLNVDWYVCWRIPDRKFVEVEFLAGHER